MRKLTGENDSLLFRNEQLTKRVETLQASLNNTNATFLLAKNKKVFLFFFEMFYFLRSTKKQIFYYLVNHLVSKHLIILIKCKLLNKSLKEKLLKILNFILRHFFFFFFLNNKNLFIKI